MGSGPERAPRAEGAGRPCGWQALWLADRNAAAELAESDPI